MHLSIDYLPQRSWTDIFDRGALPVCVLLLEAGPDAVVGKR